MGDGEGLPEIRGIGPMGGQMVAGDRGNGDAHRLLFDLANRGYQLSPCRIVRGAGRQVALSWSLLDALPSR